MRNRLFQQINSHLSCFINTHFARQGFVAKPLLLLSSNARVRRTLGQLPQESTTLFSCLSAQPIGSCQSWALHFAHAEIRNSAVLVHRCAIIVPTPGTLLYSSERVGHFARFFRGGGKNFAALVCRHFAYTFVTKRSNSLRSRQRRVLCSLLLRGSISLRSHHIWALHTACVLTTH